MLNLCLHTAVTRMLSVENHVCELQLLTADFVPSQVGTSAA